ncbi:hypothetical protein D1AOALGA4SA_3295 [Olavius algarvensis Delta 1 endosymbiont]|nr:hypothetical protein D1AOALGA4SA_3295 [Olavius algarvensis Delta 1 endosymbiont]
MSNVDWRMVESLRSVILNRQNTLNPKSAFQNLKFAFRSFFSLIRLVARGQRPPLL